MTPEARVPQTTIDFHIYHITFQTPVPIAREFVANVLTSRPRETSRFL